MARRKNWSAEQIVTKLRQIEIQMVQGKSLALACKDAEIGAELQDECLKREIFYSLRKAQVVIGAWRGHYNRIRPHSSSGYRPPASDVCNPAGHPTPPTHPSPHALVSVSPVKKPGQITQRRT